MAIIKNKKLNKDLERKVYSELLKEFRKVNSFDNVDGFLDAFMTFGEKTIFLRRFAVIKLLEEKKTYRDIKDLLDISRATISNIQDIMAGRGYGINPDRRRKYSESKAEKKSKKFKRKYKGATNIIDFI